MAESIYILTFRALRKIHAANDHQKIYESHSLEWHCQSVGAIAAVAANLYQIGLSLV